MGAPLEPFSSSGGVSDVVKGGFFLRKKPLGFRVLVNIRAENAVVDFGLLLARFCIRQFKRIQETRGAYVSETEIDGGRCTGLLCAAGPRGVGRRRPAEYA